MPWHTFHTLLMVIYFTSQRKNWTESKLLHSKSYFQNFSGLSELCTEVSKFHRHFEGVEVDPQTLVTAPGTKELIFLTMRVFNGPVILINPGWSTYAPQVNLAGRTLHVVDTTAATQWKVQPETLDNFLRENCREEENKLLVLNNPGNPSGTVYSPAELKGLVYENFFHGKISINTFSLEKCSSIFSNLLC